MNKSLLIKTGKGLLASAGVLFSITLVWANWDPASYSEKNVPSVVYVAMDLSSSTNTEKYKEIENQMNAWNGVTACSVNSVGKLAGVMFVSSLLTKEAIQEKISSILGSSVKEKEFEAVKGACPVGGLTSFILGLKQTLRFRS